MAVVVPIRGDLPPTPPDATAHHFARGDDAELAQATLALVAEGCPMTYDALEMWRYLPGRGVWELVGLPTFEHLVTSWAGEPVGFGQAPKPLLVTAARVKGASYLARNDLMSRLGRVEFAQARRGVALGDGFATVIDGAVVTLPHAPENGARHGYAFPLDREARTPLLDAFWDVIFGDCSEGERTARVMVLQEFVGACLLGVATKYQRCLYLFSGGNTGKSEVLLLLRGLFPPGSVASLPPQKWGERFALAGLEGRLANFVGETPEDEVSSGASFKSVVTGDWMVGERKGRDLFEFAPIAGHIMSANSPLRTTDHSEGFWRRPLVLPLTRPMATYPGRRRSGEAAGEILAAELPGLIAWALEGAARLQRQGAYTASEESARIAREWRDESDAVRMFLLDDSTWALAAGGVSATTLYTRFVNWTKENGHKTCSSTMLGRRARSSGLVEMRRTERGTTYERAQ